MRGCLSLSLFFLWFVHLHAKEPVDAILTDIEGTTTSISFVHDTLFPYAQSHVKEYLQLHQEEPAVSELMGEVARIAGEEQVDFSRVADILLSWMLEDRKITVLKTLQGMMWKEGYERGDFQGHVYLDAWEGLQRWYERGLSLYVYSSGSETAQRLLFSYSTCGDMTALFSGYFDTKIGGKRESSSYCKIAEQMGLPPHRILFLSDVIEELDAAAAAGMQTCLIARAIEYCGSCPHPVESNFDGINP